MKIIKRLVVLMLSLLVVSTILINVNANQHCDDLYKTFINKCIPSNMTFKSCCDYKIFPLAPSGVYKIRKGTFDTSARAYCDMTSQGGGWIVIQRNKKRSLVNFYRNWTDYEEGFGDLNTEFWYGLKEISCLTRNGQWEMRVDYQINNKSWHYAHYNQFSVGSATDKYPLTVGGFTGMGYNLFMPGNRPDQLNQMKFTTADNDNDKGGGNCGIGYKNGWWYNNCAYVNINHQPPYYYYPKTALFTEMKIRPRNCNIQ